jgi:hypothetical protein
VVRALAADLDDQALAARLGAGAARVARLVPELGERLGTAAPPPAPPPRSDAARFSLFQAIGGFLRRSAAARPLVLVMEDLQAADDASLLLLEFLVKDVHGARLLVVGTYRDLTADRVHGIGDAMGQLVREGHLLRLGGLDRREVRELIEAISGSVPSEATAAAVHEATEGNPLFVRETVRLLATDVTLADPGRLRVPLSGSVRTAIGRRLAPLSADAVLVLSAAGTASPPPAPRGAVRAAADPGPGGPAPAGRRGACPCPGGRRAGRAPPGGRVLDRVAYGGSVVRLRDTKGLRHLARLLTDPAREVLAAELARAVGLGGRDRRAASHAERARLNSTRAIRAAMANLARAHPSLGEHLSSTIRTGRYCSYTPDPRAPIRWEG